MITNYFWLIYCTLILMIVLSGLILYLCEQDKKDEPNIEGRKNGRKKE